jgi:hypothetical protein
MSVTTTRPDENGFAFTALGRVCFYCNKPLIDPSVYWLGATGEIYLHPSCVLDLFVRLARDVHEAECPDHYARLRRRAHVR